LEIESVFGGNSLVVIVFGLMITWLKVQLFYYKVCHELTLKIETRPLFQLEIYIMFYNCCHHNDGTVHAQKLNTTPPNLRSAHEYPYPVRSARADRFECKNL